MLAADGFSSESWRSSTFFESLLVECWGDGCGFGDATGGVGVTLVVDDGDGECDACRPCTS